MAQNPKISPVGTKDIRQGFRSLRSLHTLPKFQRPSGAMCKLLYYAHCISSPKTKRMLLLGV